MKKQINKIRKVEIKNNQIIVNGEVFVNVKKINKIRKWLEDIVWCNAHDTAWIEKTIEKLKEKN